MNKEKKAQHSDGMEMIEERTTKIMREWSDICEVLRFTCPQRKKNTAQTSPHASSVHVQVPHLNLFLYRFAKTYGGAKDSAVHLSRLIKRDQIEYVFEPKCLYTSKLSNFLNGNNDTSRLREFHDTDR